MCRPCRNNPREPTARSVDVVTHLLERDHVAGGNVVQCPADRIERVVVVQDVGSLLPRRTVIDGHEHRRRPTVPSDDHVLAVAHDVIQQISEPSPQLPNRHRLRHADQCPTPSA